MTKKVILSVAALVLVVVAVTGYFATRNDGPTAGAAGGLLAENYLPFILYNGGFNTAKSIKTTGDLTVGASGSTITQVLKGNCALIDNGSSFTASTTRTYDCAVTGVQSGDFVTANFATSTTAANIPFMGWQVIATAPSTTAGFITLVLANETGANAVISTESIGSTTVYHIFR